MKIIISPFSKPLRNGIKEHPKNYPYWKQLVKILEKDGHEILQVGVCGEEKFVENCKFDLPFGELKVLLNWSEAFISVDNFFHHFAHHYGRKGIVIFSSSDPAIFGYRENMNLLKDRKYLRPDQFGIWESWRFDKEAFVLPYDVLRVVREI
jgi:ADP-heptose:LPS heptosyltransferase